MTVHDVNVVIQSSSFTRNHALAGGAIHVQQNSSLSITDSHLSSNIATIKGGAICGLIDVDINGTNATFENNSAVEGGAVSLHENTRSHFLQCHFDDNSVDLFAGALLVLFNSTSTISNCMFNNNSAMFAGAIGSSGYSNLNVFDNFFISNSVGSIKSLLSENVGGGAMCFMQDVFANLSNNIFHSNTADYGGALGCARFAEILLSARYCEVCAR